MPREVEKVRIAGGLSVQHVPLRFRPKGEFKNTVLIMHLSDLRTTFGNSQLRWFVHVCHMVEEQGYGSSPS